MVLERLQEETWASHLILGGGIALSHYLEYRETNDIDCWWGEESNAEERAQTLCRLEDLLREEVRKAQPNAEIRRKAWGETESIDVLLAGTKIFSVQIASRTVHLEPPRESPWGTLKIEGLDDNLASKMTALVNRGSPRDFLDIYTAIERGVTTWEDCWKLWQRKNPRHAVGDGQLAVRVSLNGIKARRPLSTLEEPKRAQAIALRDFFQEKLTQDLDAERPQQ